MLVQPLERQFLRFRHVCRGSQLNFRRSLGEQLVFKQGNAFINSSDGVVYGRNVLFWFPSAYCRGRAGTVLERLCKLWIERHKCRCIICPAQKFSVRGKGRRIAAFAAQSFERFQRALRIVHFVMSNVADNPPA